MTRTTDQILELLSTYVHPEDDSLEDFELLEIVVERIEDDLAEMEVMVDVLNANQTTKVP